MPPLWLTLVKHPSVVVHAGSWYSDEKAERSVAIVGSLYASTIASVLPVPVPASLRAKPYAVSMVEGE